MGRHSLCERARIFKTKPARGVHRLRWGRALAVVERQGASGWQVKRYRARLGRQVMNCLRQRWSKDFAEQTEVRPRNIFRHKNGGPIGRRFIRRPIF